MKIAFSDQSLPKTGTLVVGVHEGPEWGPAGKSLDKKSQGGLARFAAAQKFTGKKGETAVCVTPGGLDLDRVILVGLGAAKDLTTQKCVEAGGAAAGVVQVASVEEVFAVLDVKGAMDNSDASAAFAQGFKLRSYRFDKYFTKTPKDKKPVLSHLTVVTSEERAAKSAFAKLDAIADGVVFARDVVTEPANVLYPESYAERIEALSKLGVKVTVFDEKQLKKFGMGALLGVAQGSVRPARMVIMQYNGNPKSKNKKPVALVGKGVTFDTGGISIKPAGGMEDMKYDMGGSAAVVGTMMALAARKAKVNVIGAVGLVENMPDGNAQRPGDVVTTMSGQTVEVINTDAEGRLVLCDVLHYVQQKHRPHTIIDLATLTGAIVVSLATNEYAGMFSNNDALCEQLSAAGQAVDERVWRFPMGDAYDKMIASDIADMKNVSDGRGGGSITAAQFLARFIEKDVAWAHLDIAGMAWARRDFTVTPKGATGYGVRLLNQWLADNYEGK